MTKNTRLSERMIVRDPTRSSSQRYAGSPSLASLATHLRIRVPLTPAGSRVVDRLNDLHILAERGVNVAPP